MSQFSRKYYNLDYKPNNRNYADDTNENVWEFWRVWGFFEYAVIILLLLILFCVCTLKTDDLSSFFTQQSSPDREVVTIEPRIKQTDEKEYAKLDLGVKFPKKVLPDFAMPKETQIDGKTLYGPISIEDYLYFVDATDGNLPDFLDKTTRRIIKKKAPVCFRPECPLQSGVTKNDLDAYAVWVSHQIGENLNVVAENGKYYLSE